MINKIMTFCFTVVSLAVLSSCVNQTKLKTLRVGIKTIKVEVADNEVTRQTGLMNRKSLNSDSGMFFIFDSEKHLGFWMKNTLIPLSIGFFNKNCRLVDIQEMTPAKKSQTHPKTYQSLRPAIYALEMNKNWFSKNKIKLNDRLVAMDSYFSFCKK